MLLVNKYSGGTYCGNGYFDTLAECYEFVNDGFCDYGKIVNDEGRRVSYRLYKGYEIRQLTKKDWYVIDSNGNGILTKNGRVPRTLREAQELIDDIEG